MTLVDLLAFEVGSPAAWLAGGTGAGISALITRWWHHKRETRKATDDVALSVTATLTTRIEVVERELRDERVQAKHERELCDEKLTSVRHELGNTAMQLENVLLALEFVAPDRIPDVVERIKTRLGDKRNAAQAKISEARVIRDVTAGKLE